MLQVLEFVRSHRLFMSADVEDRENEDEAMAEADAKDDDSGGGGGGEGGEGGEEDHQEAEEATHVMEDVCDLARHHHREDDDEEEDDEV